MSRTILSCRKRQEPLRTHPAPPSPERGKAPRPPRRPLALVLIALVLIAFLAGGAVPVPEGYRLDDYHAPVPDRVPGGTVLDLPALQHLIAASHPLLIDVLPAPRKPQGMKPSMLWLPPPHLDLPGSIWIPDAGRGALAPSFEAWLRATLARLTKGDITAPMVFYCQAECWMSWNAAKRVASWGYRRVYWYPDGVDGWKKAGLPLAPATPLTPETPLSAEAPPS
jgi:PQQ-dependent catabolism-associated CXXCW motif protein